MASRVQEAVNGALASALLPPLSRDAVLSAIARGASLGSQGTLGRHWVLDPVDGTLGFVRGDQYAIALALVEGGKVVVGVLGCPNMPVQGDVIESPDALSYGFSSRAMAKLLAGVQGAAAGAWIRGVLFKAAAGGGTWAEPSALDVRGVAPARVACSAATTWENARFCEPVLKANSSQGFTARVADAVGIRSKPLRVYSMARRDALGSAACLVRRRLVRCGAQWIIRCVALPQVKYGSVARGDAEVFMKFPKAGYKEKVPTHNPQPMATRLGCNSARPGLSVELHDDPIWSPHERSRAALSSPPPLSQGVGPRSGRDRGGGGRGRRHRRRGRPAQLRGRALH